MNNFLTGSAAGQRCQPVQDRRRCLVHLHGHLVPPQPQNRSDRSGLDESDEGPDGGSAQGTQHLQRKRSRRCNEPRFFGRRRSDRVARSGDNAMKN